MDIIKIILYIVAFIFSNLLVLKYGQYGLIISSLLLVPFDFIVRCLFHEQWKGSELFLKLGSLVLISSIITYIINKDAQNIALASVFGFISAQIVAGIFYQAYIKESYFIKVNGSDSFGIIFDSIVFQLIAFGIVTPYITISQVLLKITGGLFWYWVIFKKYKLHQKW